MVLQNSPGRGPIILKTDWLLRFERHYEQAAMPFEWKFTRRNLEDLIAKLQDPDVRLAAA